MKVSISEILQKCDKLKARKDKVTFLKNNSSPALKMILGYCFDPRIKWMLPEGKPPFKLQPREADLQNVLFAEIRRLKIFINSVEYKDVKPIRRETLFVQFLESLDPDDALLIASIKDRIMPYKTVTKDVVAQAFPNLAKEW